MAPRAGSGIIGVTDTTSRRHNEPIASARLSIPGWTGLPSARITRPREGTRMSLKGLKLEKFKQRLIAKRRELIS